MAAVTGSNCLNHGAMVLIGKALWESCSGSFLNESSYRASANLIGTSIAYKAATVKNLKLLEPFTLGALDCAPGLLDLFRNVLVGNPDFGVD